jgi:hypothetical protein
MYKDVVFLTFFEIGEHTEFVPEELLHLLNTMDHKMLGYRSVLYLPEARGMATLLGDMSALSRADSYFTNLKMPWDKDEQKEIVFSVGLFETLVQRPNEETRFIKALNFSYGYQAICMAHSEMLGLFAVGLDNGHVHLYKVEANRLNKITEDASMKVHNKRVMSLAFDSLRGILFTIGEDGFLQASDVNRRQVLGCSLISGHARQVQALRNVLRQRLQKVVHH